MDEIKEEKIFEHYLEFPADVRMVVINEMSIEDRCRFTRCSSICQNEAQKSKNYIYGLKFRSEDCILQVLRLENNQLGNYTVQFYVDEDGKNYMNHSTPFQSWITELNIVSSTKLVEYAKEQFKNMLQMYQNTIKLLSVERTRNYNFGIRSLGNLEVLKLGNQTGLRQFISKIRKPLRELKCLTPINRIIARDFEQIYETQDVFKVNLIHISYAQFQKLSARKMYMDIGKLTEEDIFEFIKCWKNNKLRNSFRYCEWSISYSRFELKKLFRLLGIYRKVEERQRWKKIKIKHKTDVGKKAELGFRDGAIYFCVVN